MVDCQRALASLTVWSTIDVDFFGVIGAWYGAILPLVV